MAEKENKLNEKDEAVKKDGKEIVKEEKKLKKELKKQEKLLKKEEKDKVNAHMEALEKKIKTLEEELESWKNKFYLARADMDNLRKQYAKDHQDVVRYRAMGFLEKLLPVFDGFHMAIQTKPNDEVLKNYLTGFEFIYRQLTDALDSEGVKEVAPKVGEAFDSRTMHAIEAEASETLEPNRIVRVYMNGYLLHDRIVRPAMVIVSKAKEVVEEVKVEEPVVEQPNESNQEPSQEEKELN